MRFPLGELRKDRGARARRDAAGLAVARRRDSQDLCFLAGTGREAFLARHGGLSRARARSSAQAGDASASTPGAHLFTVGQRRGLGLPGRGSRCTC